MSKYFFLLIVVTVIASCNNEPSNKEVDALKTAPLVYKNDSTKKDTTTAIDVIRYSGYELTTGEMQDDSVFTNGSQPASWENAGFDHPVKFKKFLKRLQYWVANNQKDSVAAAIKFPLKHPPVKDKMAFLEKYDDLINEKVKKELIEQNLRQIFRRDQGAMIGDGALWFNETPKGFVIITINNN